jgi:hypothetical protein
VVQPGDTDNRMYRLPDERSHGLGD